MSVTGGVSWEEVLGPLKAINAFWVVLFLFYICFTHFAVLNVSSALSIWGQFRSKSTHVLNVLTAVFCQSAIDGAQNDHASKVHAVLANKQVHLAKIHELFAKFGAENGVITFNMFQQKINAPEVRDWICTWFLVGSFTLCSGHVLQTVLLLNYYLFFSKTLQQHFPQYVFGFTS